MWTCTCGYQNVDIGNFCVTCGAAKSAALSAQLSDDAAWFYYKGNQRFGPVSSHEIAGLLHAGGLDRETPPSLAETHNSISIKLYLLAGYSGNQENR